MDEFIAVTKALSDLSRVRALMALKDGELCVCQIIELLKLAPSTVSKHMSVLKQAKLVESRKKERWMYYSIPEKQATSYVINEILECVSNVLKNDENVLADRKMLEKITRQDLLKICKKQRCK